jgi:hypothetical protein
VEVNRLFVVLMVGLQMASVQFGSGKVVLPFAKSNRLWP